MKKLIFLFAVIFVLSMPGLATDYYVAQSDGNDGYDGLTDSYSSGSNGPWLTIAYACTQLSAGDTVYIRTGTYSEAVWLTTGNSGTSGNPITYINYPGESPVMDGGDSLAFAFKSGMWASPAGAVDYITIDGIEVMQYTGSGIQFERDQTTQAGSTGSHDIIIQNCTTHDNGVCGIYIEGGDVGTGGESYNILITNNESYNNLSHNIKFQGDSAGTIDRLQIRDSEISHNVARNGLGGSDHGAGIHVSTGGHDLLISHNTCYQNGTWGLSTYQSWNNIIEYNICYDNGQVGTSLEVGIYQGYPSNNIVRYNLIYDNDESGIYVSGDLGGSPTKSFFYGNVIFDNNTESNTNDGGITLYNSLAHDVFNNTLYNNLHADIYLRSAVDHQVKNNIMFDTGGNSAHFLIRVGVKAGWTANKIDYNCYTEDSFNCPMLWQDVYCDDLAEWRTESSMDSNGIQTDPKFRDVTNDNFRIFAHSPCVDAGVDVGLTLDYDGVRIHGKAPDMGAHETIPVIIAKLRELMKEQQ